MPRKPVDDTAQRGSIRYKSAIYYNLYADIYKRDSPLRNNNATEGNRKSGLHSIFFCIPSSKPLGPAT